MLDRDAGRYPVRPADADRESCGAMPSGRNAPTAFWPPGYPALLAGIHAAGDPLPVARWTVAESRTRCWARSPSRCSA